ncbi:MAG TPA: 30S ribosomal protein S7 [Coprothermobacter proteolyticus]|uniref:Small ribosomal subunit protein uS7 n=1 Tax=Coprothermobacter proteolyticus (strain ATCC 35245 / DSM 5265 / OCM 4 / BT) TaxID=309798 RepID=RS7_COPPD|nr:30S ribosomal protein S7 [Coprothermobacter proteolyticus]B5Y991.1 RecName: Full=Small ribosomal subunit protein uS7; AltName: Full=30S ribosomal protein S7 [Coprothermobacter proteolyticus DSM 5265]MBK6586408.1 30S ribosomal protein S7 [Coprothermobacter sp.]ACI17416.1 30S ribosomal protein S7 [Coprothermobacter proteolyticus DSM 5265]MBP8983390.1 30S ribosomal protein S7 [Coprothermobacter sp.]NLT84074.1 30S ribosomal protein S7 [Coprothermobacter proteolyticus]HOA65287.1 30S ribosomal p
MPRGGSPTPRTIPADPIYGSTLVAKLINKIMIGGKKSKAEKIVYEALRIASEQLNEDPIAVLTKAIENTKPLVETRSRRIGGAVYQIPVEVPERRALALALRWIVNGARDRGAGEMEKKLAAELVDAYKGQGYAAKRREEIHRMAEANKAFAHLRW